MSSTPAVSDATTRRLQDALLGMLAIPSVTGEEAALADWWWDWAARSGLWTPQQRERHGNAMVLGAPDEQRPTIALVGHLDTVPPAGGEFTLPRVLGPDGESLVDQQGDQDAAHQGATSSKLRRIEGLGASDMKSGLAVMQVLVETLALGELPFNPVLVLYDREEGAFADNGLEPLLLACHALKAVDLAIVMEPTDNALELGCLGGLQATVRFSGRSAHSARPWQGDNAIHKAGTLLASLAARTPQDVAVEGLVFRNVISATRAQGGRARNVIPDEFVLNINSRFAPSDGALSAAEAELRALCVGAECTITDVSPPGPVPLGNPILAHFRALLQPRVAPKQAWTDVARLAAHGIDAVNFGPGSGNQAHQAGEWVALGALVDSYEMLHKFFTTPLTL